MYVIQSTLHPFLGNQSRDLNSTVWVGDSQRLKPNPKTTFNLSSKDGRCRHTGAAFMSAFIRLRCWNNELVFIRLGRLRYPVKVTWKTFLCSPSQILHSERGWLETSSLSFQVVSLPTLPAFHEFLWINKVSIWIISSGGHPSPGRPRHTTFVRRGYMSRSCIPSCPPKESNYARWNHLKGYVKALQPTFSRLKKLLSETFWPY